MVDDTHRIDLRSWVESASAADSDFPIQNLPYGVFRSKGSDEAWRVGVAIGDQILDLSASAKADLLGAFSTDLVADSLFCGSLNAIMRAGTETSAALRRHVSSLLRPDTHDGAHAKARRRELLMAQQDAEFHVPALVGDFTDFYASIHHATNVGSMFRPDSPLFPNYKWLPIGYHGRASSIVVSDTPVKRPRGQSVADGAAMPTFGPSRRLDYEAELGFYVGQGTALGETLTMRSASRHLFGVCLLNDWSARDIQAWEYQPLGPFLAKNFATSVSPWVVTMEALAPFRSPAYRRPEGDPAPLAYLADADDQAHGALDAEIEVYLRTVRMREAGVPAVRLSRGNSAGMYWTPAQLLVHHSSNGCNLLPGDIVGSGTISGPTKESRGCLLELTWRGSEPITLPTGEERRFLEDGDEVTMRARCEREGFASIGFGECTGLVLPA